MSHQPFIIPIAVGAEFGTSVSLSGDGKTLAIGANGERSGATGINGDQEDNSEIQSGAVYLYSIASRKHSLQYRNI